MRIDCRNRPVVCDSIRHHGEVVEVIIGTRRIRPCCCDQMWKPRTRATTNSLHAAPTMHQRVSVYLVQLNKRSTTLAACDIESASSHKGLHTRRRPLARHGPAETTSSTMWPSTLHGPEHNHCIVVLIAVVIMHIANDEIPYVPMDQ